VKENWKEPNRIAKILKLNIIVAYVFNYKFIYNLA